MEFTTIGDFATGYQSENIKFDERSLIKIGELEKHNVSKFCDTNINRIFGNRGKAVAKEQINYIPNSLLMIAVTNFEIIQKTYDDNPHPQIRIVFNYNDNNYNFPITDPAFLHKYKSNPDILNNVIEMYLVLSLGVEYKDWYYKLAAGIIF